LLEQDAVFFFVQKSCPWIRGWISCSFSASKNDFDSKFTPERRLDGRVSVVTGANSGVGLATSVALVGLGSQVILACRNEEKAKAAIQHILTHHPSSSHLVTYLPLDTSSLSSVISFTSALPPKLDILINNAGVVKVPEEEEGDGVCPVFKTNFLGHFLLTNLVIGKLKESARSGFSARVVNVSSGRHADATISWEGTRLSADAYGQSKLAQIMAGKHLQKMINEEPSALWEERVQVISITPGFVMTNILSNFRQDFSWFKTIIFYLMIPIMHYFSRTPTAGAQVMIMAAVGDNVEGGKYYSNCYEKPTIGQNDMTNNEKECQKLWEMSERLVEEEKKREGVKE